MNENFEKLRQLVLQDSALQKELRSISGSDEFVRRVVEIGREKGLNFGEEDVWAAINEGRRVWIERWI